jgi:hypothetical protein
LPQSDLGLYQFYGVKMDYGMNDRLVDALKSMGYRWKELSHGEGCFLKPIGHVCFICRGNSLDMVFEELDLSVHAWDSNAINVDSSVSLVRQIMIAEAYSLAGAPFDFDRSTTTFAFLSVEEEVAGVL